MVIFPCMSHAEKACVLFPTATGCATAADAPLFKKAIFTKKKQGRKACCTPLF